MKRAAGLIASLHEHFKNYDMATDQDVFATMTEMYITKWQLIKTRNT